MLGEAGVGKTSSLVAMLEHFKNDFFESLDLQFSIDQETGRKISQERARLINSLDKGAVEITDGIAPTSQLERYDVSINGKHKALSTPLNVSFVDYPGSWLDASSGDGANVREILASSKVLVIPIDSPMLMEREGNQSSERILHILKDLFVDLNESRLVVFAPVKSEKYYEAEDGNPSRKAYDDLIKKFQEKYEDVLSFLTSRQIKKNVSVIITPIQTLGNCKLMYFAETEDNSKVPVFVVTQRGVYAPKHSQRPLIYLLSFLLRERYESQRKGLRGFFGKMNGDLGNLANYSEKLSLMYSNYNGGVKIIQNSVITNF